MFTLRSPSHKDLFFSSLLFFFFFFFSWFLVFVTAFLPHYPLPLPPAPPSPFPLLYQYFLLPCSNPPSPSARLPSPPFPWCTSLPLSCPSPPPPPLPLSQAPSLPPSLRHSICYCPTPLCDSRFNFGNLLSNSEGYRTCSGDGVFISACASLLHIT